MPREHWDDYEWLVDSLREEADRIIEGSRRIGDIHLLYDIIFMGDLSQCLHLEVPTCGIVDPWGVEKDIRDVMSRYSDVLRMAEERGLDVRMYRRNYEGRTENMLGCLRDYKRLLESLPQMSKPPCKKVG